MNPLKWLTLPPIIAIGTVAMTRTMASTLAAENVNPAIWMLTVLLFVILTALYGMFITYDFNAGLLPLQLLAQGLLICPLSLSMGARMFAWVGVTMAICGAVVLATLYNRVQAMLSEAPAAKQSEEAPPPAALLIPVAYAITDGEGTIINASNAMLATAALSRDKVLGQSITVLLTPGEDTAEIGGKTWQVTQIPMDGDCYYFQIDEPRADAASSFDAAAASRAGGGLFDPVTHLHTFQYAMSRLDEELYRTGRYERPLSAALLRFALPPDLEEGGAAQDAFNAYCSLVGDNLRLSDTAASPEAWDILLVLPECPKELVETVIGKLLALAPSLHEAHPMFEKATPLYVSLSLTGTEDLPNAGKLLDRLHEALAQKYALPLG